MILIEHDKVYIVDKEKKSVLHAYSPFVLETKNPMIQFIGSIENITSKRVLKKIRSIQELIVEGNETLLIWVIDKIKEQYKGQEILIKSVPCITNELKARLKKYNVAVQPCKLIKNYKREGAIQYGLVVEEITRIMMENSREQLEHISMSEIPRIRQYLRLQAAHIFQKLAYKQTAEINMKVLDENKCVKEITFRLDEGQYKECDNIQRLIEGNVNLSETYRSKEQFKVVFISPFSFGKSTLINALIGKELLKTDVRAETANVTKLIQSQENKILITSGEGDKTQYQEQRYSDEVNLIGVLEELTSVHESGNSIREITILGNIGMNKDITFIDSPGLFSRYSHHDALSQEALEQGDLIVYVFDPESVGDENFSASIKKQAKWLLAQGKALCIVLTKRDLFDQYEEEKVLEETEIVLKELGLEGVKVLFVSAYMGLKCSQLQRGDINFDDFRKDRLMFVIDDNELIRGRHLKEEHIPKIEKYSNIQVLKQYIVDTMHYYT